MLGAGNQLSLPSIYSRHVRVTGYHAKNVSEIIIIIEIAFKIHCILKKNWSLCWDVLYNVKKHQCTL